MTTITTLRDVVAEPGDGVTFGPGGQWVVVRCWGMLPYGYEVRPLHPRPSRGRARHVRRAKAERRQK